MDACESNWLLNPVEKIPVNWRFDWFSILVYIAAHAVQSTWTYINIEKFKWSESLIGYSLGVVGLLVAIVQGGLIRYITPKIGNEKSVYIGLSLYALGLLLFAFAS